MASKKSAKPSAPREEKTKFPPPEKIVAALKATVLKKGLEWPIDYPSAHGLKADKQDYAFYLEIRALFATKLSWVETQGFIGKCMGKPDKSIDWTHSFRAALDLAYHALGVPDLDELEGQIPNRIATLKLWGIDPSRIVKETDMAKKTAVVENKGTKTGRVSSKEENKSNTPKGKAATTPLAKVKKAEPVKISDENLGGLGVWAAVFSSAADHVGAMVDETPGDEDLAELAETLTKAAKLLAKVTA